jgi:hypothetical protein
MKVFESIKRHPRIVAGTTAVLLGAGALETVGYLQNPTHDRPHGACVSPVAASETYVDRGANLLLQTDTGLFTTGVVARGKVPPGAYGVEATFKSPDADATAWDANASRMITAGNAGSYALKMAIGNGEVEFGVRVVAPEGSPACTTPPEVSYTHVGAADYFNASGNLPWPNPVSVVVNIF